MIPVNVMRILIVTLGYTETDLLGIHCIALRNAIQLQEMSSLHHPSFG